MQSIRTYNALCGPYWIGSTKIDAPLPSGWLSGDQWDGTTLKRAKHKPIVGIVDLTNRTRYGFSSHNVPLYLFHPLDPAYPPMIVGSKAPTTANRFGIATFDSWDTVKSKWPRASLQRLLDGTVGCSKTEQEALRFRVSPSTKQKTETFQDLQVWSGIPTESWDVCLHIDPEGCRDVDDILCWRTLPNGATEFAIGIADVSAWIPEGSQLDEEAKQKAQTVYEDGSVLYPMFPPEISEQSASLRSDGITRPVLACTWTLHSDGSVCPPVWKNFATKVHTTYSYESVYESTELCNTLTGLISRVIGKDVGTDSHVWIEHAMITYNREAARLLRSAGKGVLRMHAGKSSTELCALSEKTGCRDIAWLGASAGEYVPANMEGDVHHSGLGESVYCHASSPLRRYADLVNQRTLKSLLFPTSSCSEPVQLNELCWSLNAKAKTIKAFERDLWYIQHIKPDALSKGQGFVVGWKPLSETLVNVTVYVPEWKRSVRIRMCVTEMLDDSVSVQALQTNTSWSLRKGDSVQITAFCDLRVAKWSERFVFQLAPLSGLETTDSTITECK
jgi:hypothetical protein